MRPTQVTPARTHASGGRRPCQEGSCLVRRDNRYLEIARQNQEVLIAGHQRVCSANDSQLEERTVERVAARGPTPRWRARV